LSSGYFWFLLINFGELYQASHHILNPWYKNLLYIKVSVIMRDLIARFDCISKYNFISPSQKK
jgi:hypothetical protein